MRGRRWPRARSLPRLSTEPSEPTALRGSDLYRLAWVFYLLLAAAGLVWLGWQAGRISPALFVDVATWPVDLAVGLATGGLLLGLWWWALHKLAAARALEERLGELVGELGLAQAIGLALLSGVAEEVLFRGAMQRAWGWPLATAIFALLHVGPAGRSRLWMVYAAIAGLAFAALVEWRGTLLAAISAHALVNAVNLGRLTRA